MMDSENLNTATLDQGEKAPAPGANPSHRIHFPLPIASRVAFVKWIIDEVLKNGEHRFASKTVRQFPQFFRSSPNANITRATRLWKERHKCEPPTSATERRQTEGRHVTRMTSFGRRVVILKARPGRGRKRAAWVSALHADLRGEFDRLRNLGVKFNLVTLRHLAKDVLKANASDAYSENMIDPRPGQPLHLKIDTSWIQGFVNRFHIVSRVHKGKRKVSPEKKLEIEISVASHLGTLCGLLGNGILDENDVENADETHFVFNVDNGRTLGFSGEHEVKHADVVSGGEGFTMLVRVSGGRDSRIGPSFLVFQNKHRNYAIRNVPDNLDRVVYCTGPKGWMDQTVMPQWLGETRVIRPLPNERGRVLYMDNCSGHNETDQLNDAAERIRTNIAYFLSNSTHLVQPCDSFVIQKIKRAWTTHWESYKMNMIKAGKWKESSGRICNPGKSYFLQLAARCVREVNWQRDENRLTYGRKALIITGMALNTNGQWKIGQLTPDLQRIVANHRTVFDVARSAVVQDTQ